MSESWLSDSAKRELRRLHLTDAQIQELETDDMIAGGALWTSISPGTRTLFRRGRMPKRPPNRKKVERGLLDFLRANGLPIKGRHALAIYKIVLSEKVGINFDASDPGPALRAARADYMQWRLRNQQAYEQSAHGKLAKFLDDVASELDAKFAGTPFKKLPSTRKNKT